MQTAGTQAGGPKQEFVVTPELYNKTFDEAKKVIADLTAIIAAEDYQGWLSYLTEEYVARTSDPEVSCNGIPQRGPAEKWNRPAHSEGLL